MPSYALENLLSVYMNHFKPINHEEMEFMHRMQEVLRFPLRSYDSKFSQDIAFRFSAGVYFLGLKEIEPQDSVIPQVLQEVYQRDREIQNRYPDMRNFSTIDNLMTWAKKDGRRYYEEIARFFDSLEPFSKYWDKRPFSRPWLETKYPKECSDPGFKVSIAARVHCLVETPRTGLETTKKLRC